MNIQQAVKKAVASTRNYSRSALFHIEERRFIKAVCALAETAETHHAFGVPAGDHIYGTLFSRARLLGNAFVQRWNIEAEDLYAEIPGLERLRRLAEKA